MTIPARFPAAHRAKVTPGTDALLCVSVPGALQRLHPLGTGEGMWARSSSAIKQTTSGKVTLAVSLVLFFYLLPSGKWFSQSLQLHMHPHTHGGCCKPRSSISACSGSLMISFLSCNSSFLFCSAKPVGQIEVRQTNFLDCLLTSGNAAVLLSGLRNK